MREPSTAAGRALASRMTGNADTWLAAEIIAIEDEAAALRATDVPSDRVDRFGRPRIGPRRPPRAATPDDGSRVVNGLRDALAEALRDSMTWAVIEDARAGRIPGGWEQAADIVAERHAALRATDVLSEQEVECWDCGGRGYTVDADPLPSGEPGEPYQVPCGACGTTGRLIYRATDVPVAEGLRARLPNWVYSDGRVTIHVEDWDRYIAAISHPDDDSGGGG